MSDQGTLFPDEPTFREVKIEWREKLEDGEPGLLCPCCGRHSKIYKRRIHAALASLLCRIYRYSVELTGYDWSKATTWPWIHIQEDIIQPFQGYVALDYHILGYFDLIELKPNEDDPKKRDSGFWRLTVKGQRFVTGWTRLPRHVYVFANRRIRFSDESADIRECLGDAYDYEELMRPAPMLIKTIES